MGKELENLSFDLPKNQSNVIKVIGVGGGGSNAVNHMCQKGIKGVDFVVCNTDAQALKNSPVPSKIQLGVSLTEGLGAGANPEVGEQAAIESIDDIKKMFGTSTKMVFITVGMGGGTGTGAAPIIAKVAKEMDLLTVGIVTIPFSFEGKMRNEQAQKGIAKIREHIDSLVVINNNKLREVYGNLGFKAGFSKADEVLSTAASGIAEVITHHYTQNIDLKDAKTVLANSGTAIMGSATATGSNRAQEAITKALDSPLLNDNRITGAKNVLLLIVSGTTEITIDEIGEINDYIQSEAKSNVDIIMGVGEEESLGEAIAVTVIATGFNIEQQMEISATESKKIVHNLGEEPKFEPAFTPKAEAKEEKVVKYTLEDVEDEVNEPLNDLIATSE
ncbi:MAG: cell division protein FtsZ, partial [Flavobacteriaceae bacterium]|nr:cell division protein FtsZ [Flavobacteriaceae bacterium]